MRVQDLTGREAVFTVEVEAGSAYEFLISLCAFGLPDEQPTYEVGREWFEKIRKGASRGLVRALDRIGPEAGKVWINLVGLATVAPTTPDVSSLHQRVSSLDALELRLYLLGAHVPHYQQSISPDVLRRAAENDPKAVEQLLEDRDYFGGEGKGFLGSLLGLSPEETKATVLEAMDRWYREVFSAREAEWKPVLLRDAQAKRRLIGTLPSDQVIEAASGIQFVPQPGIRKVFLIPQLTTRPWVWLAEHDDARIYCYPVADESFAPEGSAPPGRLVRLHKALGDEKRLRMLKAIAESTATLQELADRFSLPKSTAHHHLAILRSAGLIRVTSDEEHRYSVRHEVIPELSTLLGSYLGSGGKPGPDEASKEAPHVPDAP